LGDNAAIMSHEGACGGKLGGDVEMVRDEFIKAYDHLADGVTKSLGLDGRSSVRKVPVASIRERIEGSRAS
jgi:hypothetical protein